MQIYVLIFLATNFNIHWYFLPMVITTYQMTIPYFYHSFSIYRLEFYIKKTAFFSLLFILFNYSHLSIWTTRYFFYFADYIPLLSLYILLLKLFQPWALKDSSRWHLCFFQKVLNNFEHFLLPFIAKCSRLI